VAHAHLLLVCIPTEQTKFQRRRTLRLSLCVWLPSGCEGFTEQRPIQNNVLPSASAIRNQVPANGENSCSTQDCFISIVELDRRGTDLVQRAGSAVAASHPHHSTRLAKMPLVASEMPSARCIDRFPLLCEFMRQNGNPRAIPCDFRPQIGRAARAMPN
jgi:hypothetical protein